METAVKGREVESGGKKGGKERGWGTIFLLAVVRMELDEELGVRMY